jgi:hypothetical protein
MDWVVKKMLRIEPIEDFTDYDRIERELASLSRSLGLHLDEAESSTLQRLKNCDHTGLSFSFTQEDLDQIKGAFSRVWVPPTLHILTRFRPYADLVQARQGNDSLTVEFINWYYLKVQADRAGGGQAQQNLNQFIHRVQNRPENPIAGHVFEDALQEVEHMKGDGLAFKVVFQRSLFLAFLEFSKITDEQMDELADGGQEAVGDILDGDEGEAEDQGQELGEADALAASTIARAELLVEALNALTNAAPEFLDLRCEIEEGDVRHLLWNGTIYDAAGATIDFTGAAAVRGQEPMVWAAMLHLLDERDFFSPSGTKAQAHDFPPSSPSHTSENTPQASAPLFPASNLAIHSSVGSVSALAHRLAKDWGFIAEAFIGD